MKILLQAIAEKSKVRPAGYKEDLLSKGQVRGSYLYIDSKVYMELYRKYNHEQKLPPIREQIANAANATKRVVTAFVKGEKVMASEETVANRKYICSGCEFLRNNRCTKCGCYYSKKIKLETESCPIGKW